MYHFYIDIINRKIILLSLFLVFTSFAQATESPFSLPSVKEQISLYAKIWKEMDNPQFDPKTTPVPRLSEPLKIANAYAHKAIGNNAECLNYLEHGSSYLNSRELTLQNFIIYNYFLAFLLTDLVKDRLDPKELKNISQINLKDIGAFFNELCEKLKFRAYPFCFEGVVYTPTGVFDLDDYFEAILSEDTPPFSVAGLPLWGDKPHAGIVSAPISFIGHDRAHSGMLFDYYDDLKNGYIYWQQTRNLARKLLGQGDANHTLRKNWVFFLSHEKPLLPNILFSNGNSEQLLVDNSVQSLPLCQKRMLLNWSNEALRAIDNHRKNSSMFLGMLLHKYFEKSPLFLKDRRMNVREETPIDLGLAGEKLFVIDMLIVPVIPNDQFIQFKGQLVGTIQPSETRAKEVVTIQGIDIVKADAPTLDESAIEAFKAHMKNVKFTKRTMSRWALYAMYLYDTSNIIRETSASYLDILELPINSQIDGIQRFLRQTYNEYVGCLSEEEITLPLCELKEP